MKRVVPCLIAGLLAGCPNMEPPASPDDGTGNGLPGTKGTAMVWPDEDYRYEQPKPREAAPVRIPAITTFKIGEVEVYLAKRTTLPTVSLSLTFPGGSAGDPKGKRGLTSMCASLVDEGTKSLDKIALGEAQADLASRIYAASGSETVSIGLSSLKRNLEPTLKLMFDLVLEPGLRSTDLERIRGRRQASLTQAKAAPGSLGGRLWASVVYGPAHPYGRLTNEASLKAIKVADCKRLIGSLGLPGARLFVAGAVTEGELRTLLEPYFSRWKAKRSTAPEIPAAAPRKGTLFFVNVPKAAQSMIYVGHPGPARAAPDYEATSLMAAVLGGSFSGRVNMNIRESKGYSYGARARFRYRYHGTDFAATTSVRTDTTADSLRELAKEIDRIRTERVSAEELQREREHKLLALPARFATADRILGTYSSLVFFGLPLDYYDGHQVRLRAVERDDVLTAAQTHLKASGYKVLVVGDGATVREDLKKLVSKGLFGKEGFVELDGDGNVVGKVE